MKKRLEPRLLPTQRDRASADADGSSQHTQQPVTKVLDPNIAGLHRRREHRRAWFITFIVPIIGLAVEAVIEHAIMDSPSADIVRAIVGPATATVVLGSLFGGFAYLLYLGHRNRPSGAPSPFFLLLRALFMGIALNVVYDKLRRDFGGRRG